MSDVEKHISHSGDEHQPVTVSGESNEFVHIGHMKVRRDELMSAFGGSLYPGIMAPPTHKFANPGPLGLSAFALTTFVLSMVNARAQGVSNPKIVVGLAFFYGGFIQLCAGMWEIAVENTFGGTALSSYGGFWMSYAAIETNAFGIASSYTDETELANAVGFYLLGWTIFTAMVTICTTKSTAAFFGMFFLLTITFLLLTIGEFASSLKCTRAGGVIGVIVAFLAWYNAYAGIATPQNSYLTVKPLYLPGGRI